jgi:hypothetical protein
VETNEATVFFAANHTMDLVGGEQVAVRAVAEIAFRAMELPEGLIDHATYLPDFSRRHLTQLSPPLTTRALFGE